MAHVCPAARATARSSAPSARLKIMNSNPGTATNCSAVCGSGREERDEAVCRRILVISITCSSSQSQVCSAATGQRVRKKRRTYTTESTICGTGSWTSGKTGAESTICSTMRRGTRFCGLTPERRSGREPPSSGTLSLSSKLKYRVPGSEGVGASGSWPSTSSRTHPLSLAVLCLRGAVWCDASARAIATVIRSCFSHERSRRSRRLRAALPAMSTQAVDIMKSRNVVNTEKRSRTSRNLSCCCCSSCSCCCCCFGRVFNSVCVHSCDPMQQSLRPFGGGSPGSQDSQRPRHPPVSDTGKNSSDAELKQ